jgi:lysophospholipase L1-like esterase
LLDWPYRNQLETRWTKTTKTYLALGDSMSIDAYTGQTGGGAVAQLYKRLCGQAAATWRLDDRTVDGQRIGGVNFLGQADLITMTIGGNDLLQNMELPPAEFLPRFSQNYFRLAAGIRKAHPQATVIVGNIYEPQWPLTPSLLEALDEANRVISRWAGVQGFRLVDIRGAFQGHEDEYLCCSIEPTLKGAAVIADLFEQAAFGG